MVSSPHPVDRLFPVEERMKVWRKSNKMFKVDADTVVRFWRYNADPLRGTLIKTNDVFLLVNRPSGQVHVSDVVKGVIYGEVSPIMVLDEHKLKVLARGILFHKLFRARFSPRVRAVFELPVACSVADAVVVGTLDVLVYPEEGNGAWLIELKSSSTKTTINFGVLQVKMYWCILKNFTDVEVSSAYVLTPKYTVEVDRPITKKELSIIVKTCERQLRTQELTSSPLFRAGLSAVRLLEKKS